MRELDVELASRHEGSHPMSFHSSGYVPPPMLDVEADEKVLDRD